MKIVMIGEAAKNRDTLLAHLPSGIEVIGLPREAATGSDHDGLIEPDDVLISLRYARHDSMPPKFRLLHLPGAGLDGVDFESLPAGALVCNVFEHEIPMAEYVMAAMLNHEIGYASLCADFSNERWPALYRARVPHGELSGKTLGIIGFGRIGRELAKRAKAFGMTVVVANRSAIDLEPNGQPLIDQALPLTALDQLLTASDYVVIACPLSENTRGLIDAAALRKMHRSAVIINVSRAQIIDQEALYDALYNNRLSAAVLDVWWQYPMSNEDRPAPSALPFDQLPNVYATAHCSAWTIQLPERRYQVIAQNIRALMAGLPLTNLVQPHA
jgi:phosphoglycerate dehydrogenase-like enzyme